VRSGKCGSSNFALQERGRDADKVTFSLGKGKRIRFAQNAKGAKQTEKEFEEKFAKHPWIWISLKHISFLLTFI